MYLHRYKGPQTDRIEIELQIIPRKYEQTYKNQALHIVGLGMQRCPPMAASLSEKFPDQKLWIFFG